MAKALKIYGCLIFYTIAAHAGAPTHNLSCNAPANATRDCQAEAMLCGDEEDCVPLFSVVCNDTIVYRGAARVDAKSEEITPAQGFEPVLDFDQNTAKLRIGDEWVSQICERRS